MTALALVLSALSLAARPDARDGAAEALDRFLRGDLGLNALVNRVSFLGEQAWVTRRLLDGLGQVPDARRRDTMVEAIAGLALPGDDDAERLLLRALGQGELPVRLSAMRGLGRMRSREAVRPLVRLLEDPGATVRQVAATALGQVGAPAAARPLVDAALKEAELEPRLAMLMAVGRCQDRSVVKRLEPLLSDGSASTRLAAAQSLCLLGAPGGVAFARKLIGSAERRERLSGVLLFEGAPLKVARPALTPALEDIDPKVRATAGRILVQAGDRTRLAWLVIESSRAVGDDRRPFEEELERLTLTDEERQAILRKAGLR